jgi:FkbM family methyltransferase
MFLRLGATVVAVEPDERSQTILEQKFLTHRLKKMPLHIVAKAVSDRSSVTRMWVDAPGSAKNTLSEKWAAVLRNDENRFGHRLGFDHSRTVETISMEGLIEAYGTPFFVKIDVEGHELKVLEGLKRSVPYLSFEVNLPEFRSEGIRSIEVLDALSVQGEFNYASDCRVGLAMKQWCRAQEFASVLNRCTDASIEVFWKG